MPQPPAPIFHHGKLLVDSSGFDASVRPKYDFVVHEMAKADGVSLLHANLRTGPEDELLVIEPHCFEFNFQFTMKYFRTLQALIQADGIPGNRQLRFAGKPCNEVPHRRFADTDTGLLSNQPMAGTQGDQMEVEDDEDQWVDVREEMQSTDEPEYQVSLNSRLASLDPGQKLSYLDFVRETCGKYRLPCNIGEAYAETPQFGLLRAIWQQELPQVLSIYQSLKDSNASVPLDAAFLEAIKSRRLKLVDFFLDGGAQFTYTGHEDATIWSRQSVELYEILIRRDWHEIRTKGAFLDECLKQACTAGRADMVQYLVKKGAKPKQASWMADTSTLAQAARSTEMIEYILFDGEREPENGVYDRDALAATLKGTGAMQAAAVGNDVDVVCALLRWGADVNEVPRVDVVGDVRECDNGPALHKIFRQMGLGFGSPEAQDRHDRDMQKYFDMIVFLLGHGADPNIRDERNQTAWMLADQVGRGNKARLAEILKPYRLAEADTRS